MKKIITFTLLFIFSCGTKKLSTNGDLELKLNKNEIPSYIYTKLLKLKTDTTNYIVLRDIGYAYEQLYNIDSAKYFYLKSMYYNRDENAQAYSQIADIYCLQDSFYVACYHYATSIGNNPKSAKTLYNFANCMLNHKDTLDAAIIFKRLIKVDKHYKNAQIIYDSLSAYFGLPLLNYVDSVHNSYIQK
jgi:tetratricopeptide (TPR) repeat protein